MSGNRIRSSGVFFQIGCISWRQHTKHNAMKTANRYLCEGLIRKY